MRKRNILLIGLTVLIILVTGILFSQRDALRGLFAELTSKECTIGEDELYGNWVFPGGDIKTKPAITFERNKTFRIYDADTDTTSAKGHWSYEKELMAVSMIVNIEDNEWTEVLKMNLSIFPSVVSYDYEKKNLVLKITVKDKDEAPGCEINTLSINLFNLILYKES